MVDEINPDYESNVTQDRHNDNMRKIVQTANIQYAKLLIKQLFEDSEEVRAESLTGYGFPAENLEETVRIYRGFLIKAGEKVGLTHNHVTTAMRILYAMQSTTQLRRPSRGFGGITILNYIPTDEQYTNFKLTLSGMSRRISPSRYDAIKDDLADARVRIKELERKFKEMENYLVLIHNKLEGEP